MPHDREAHFLVELDGRPAPPELARGLRGVRVESSLHRPDVAVLTVHDARVDLVDGDVFAIGRTLRVRARAGGRDGLLFDGEIVELEPTFDQHEVIVRVTALDRLHRLTRGTHVRAWQDVTDMDLVRRLAAEVGLRARTGPDGPVHPHVVQLARTNLAFLRERAARLGFLLYVDGDTLCCHPPPSDGPAVELAWGRALTSFRPRLSSLDQPTGTVVRGWNPDRKTVVTGRGPSSGRGGAELPDPQRVTREAFDVDAPRVLARVPVRTQEVADVLAHGEVARQSDRLVQAEGAGPGHPGVVAGATVHVTGVGTRFSGTYLVSEARHEFRAGGSYHTEFRVTGRHVDVLTRLLAPPEERSVRGLVVGTVTNVDDPEGLGRVRLRLPQFGDDIETGWTRVVAPGAGPGRGVQWSPDVGDEVLVGFELGDPDHPYVLGGLWNGLDAPPREGPELVRSGRVRRRVLRSARGHELILDDDDDAPGITIRDEAGNVIRLDTRANILTVDARGDLDLRAERRVTVRANGVLIDGGAGGVDVKGAVIRLN